MGASVLGIMQERRKAWRPEPFLLPAACSHRDTLNCSGVIFCTWAKLLCVVSETQSKAGKADKRTGGSLWWMAQTLMQPIAFHAITPPHGAAGP